jgi:DNA-directed RNA polymerase subunit alpha
MSLGGGELKSLSGDLALDDLGFSVRTFNALKRVGIEKLSQILAMKYDEITGIRNLGKKSCDEIVSKLKEFGWKNDKQSRRKAKALEEENSEDNSNEDNNSGDNGNDDEMQN